MTFHEVTRVMLSSMDFFELRRTAARYSVPYQGVRRQKLVRDIERRILSKGKTEIALHPDAEKSRSAAMSRPEGAVSARPSLTGQKKPVGPTRINTFTARNSFSRPESVK